jgi:hypothetical protein
MSNQKFRTWDSAALAEAAKLSIQLTQKIEEICIDTGVTPSELPDSLIPTDKLYLMSMAYTAAYDKLIEYDLVKSGNIKQTKNTH